MPDKNNFYLNLGIKFKPDKASLNELDRLFDDYKQINLFGNDEQLEKVRKMFSKFETDRVSMLKAQRMLTSYRSAMGQGEGYQDEYTDTLTAYMKELADSNLELKKMYEKFIDKQEDVIDESTHNLNVFNANLKTNIVKGLGHLATSFLFSLTGLFKNALNELDNMVKSSFLTNDVYRTNAFSYGMTAAESYGFEQAKSMLGVNEENIWYMNDYQREKFRDVMTKYAERYQKLYDSGFFEKYLDFQIEMQEFKLDLQMSIIEFFMNNKDTIMEFMDILMDGMEFIVDAVDWLVDHFGGNNRTSDEEKLDNIESILSTYITNNNVNVQTTNNNTFNGTTDSQSSKYLDMLNAQVVEAKRAFGG